MTEPDGGYGSSCFSGIDPGRLNTMISSLDGAVESLGGAQASWVNRFSALGVDTGALTSLGGISSWVEGQLPMLKRRFDLAVAIEQNDPDPNRTMVQIPDSLMSLEEAQRKGRELAARLNNIDTVDQAGAEEIHDIAEDLAPYINDPEVAAAFFAELGENKLGILPDLMAQSGSTTGAEDLETFSRALGTAVSAEYLATPGFDQVEEMLLAPSEYPSDAWSRLALLQYGHFPTEFIETAAENLALDDFAKDPDSTDWRGGFGTLASSLGLSEDNVALALNLLGKDSIAARNVLWGMHPGSYTEAFGQFTDYAAGHGTGDDVADALGRAMESGSGVGTEQPGQHSPGAAQFAFETMVFMGDKGKDTPWSMKDSMANLAASYIHEMATGARTEDATYRESSQQEPPNFTELPGINPSFFLSPGDTEQFLTTFADSDEATDTFDIAAGAFSEEAIRGAAQIDADAVLAGESDPDQMSRVAGAFGALAGAEYRAEVAAGKDMDEQEEAVRGVFKDIFMLGLDEVPFASKVGEYSWKAAKFMIGKGADSWVEGDEENSHEKQMAAPYANYDRMQRFDMTKYLYEAGYPVEPPPPAECLNQDGTLKSYDQLREEAETEAQASNGDPNAVFQGKLQALTDWSDSTAENDGDTFDHKVDVAAGAAGGTTGAANPPDGPR
ncbi:MULTISPECIES: hypothetical protein [unclassified Streptomyces]|uniref:hypothetical protein n=1 Tax=unclassified Streptomyces TaxID=2593676 RepID=UPI002E10D190|nr:hypothetical protein OG533_05370 [Streptomyces sp. NBC_01186]WSS40109.1 hypothetical protein OG220_05465 [Streptomyces sp. NBC_01187]